MIAPARGAAFRVLLRVEAGSGRLPSALDEVQRTLDDPRDRALASEIAAGTLRWQGQLDHLLTRVAHRPLERLDPEVRALLRMSAFQLIHLDRVPASAILHDAVELTRTAGKASAAPFVNGALRALTRLPHERVLPGRTPPVPGDAASVEAALDYLSITLSHPRWLMRRWLDRLGFDEAEAWARFNNQPARVTLRANRLQADREAVIARLALDGVTAEPTRYAPDGLVAVDGNPLASPLAATGLYLAQDESSQLVAHVAGVTEGESVLDTCAAPGGKTTALAVAVAARGLVVAMELRPRRLQILRATLRRAGATAVRIVRADATRPLPFASRFDCVLVDAPCSGLGTLRREPDIRWRQQEGDLPRLADTQCRMLAQAAAVTRLGGRLVYATCSSEPEENEQVVERFLQRHPQFRPERPSSPDGRLDPLIDARGHLRTSPTTHGLEPFFGAILRRHEGSV